MAEDEAGLRAAATGMAADQAVGEQDGDGADDTGASWAEVSFPWAVACIRAQSGVCCGLRGSCFCG